MALQHPDAGFSIHNLAIGEDFVIEPGANHHVVFLMNGSVEIDSEECSGFSLREKNMVLCYRDYEYHLSATSASRIIVAYFSSLGGACDVSLLSQLYRRLGSSIKYEFTSVAFCEPMREFLDMMTRFLEDGIECKHLHYPSIQQLFVILRFYYQPKVLLKMFYNVFDNDLSFKTLVQNNRAKAKTLNELAALCGYDISTFNVMFRRHFKNITPYEWMQEHRSKEILQTLCSTTMTVSEIAEQFGFSNAGHLSLFCRKYLGDTPSKLRAKNYQNN
jgi:AraC-like DNA-binding protein